MWAFVTWYGLWSSVAGHLSQWLVLRSLLFSQIVPGSLHSTGLFFLQSCHRSVSTAAIVHITKFLLQIGGIDQITILRHIRSNELNFRLVDVLQNLTLSEKLFGKKRWWTSNKLVNSTLPLGQYLKSTVALTFGTSKVLYLRHCPCTQNYSVTFKVVQTTSEITSTTSNKVGGGGTEVRLLNV